MTKNEVMNKLNDVKKGTIIKMVWKSPYYNTKNQDVWKYTEGYIRLGIMYSHIDEVVSQHQSLKGDQKWLNEFIILNNKTNELKLRVTKCLNMNTLKNKVYYKDELTNKIYKDPSDINFLPASKKFPKSTDNPIFDVRIKNIIKIN